MLIEHRQYIALVDEIEYLKKDNSLLKQQNSILTQQLVRARQKIQQLSQCHRQNMKLLQNLHSQSISYQSQNTKEVISHISKTSHLTQEFLDKKFQALQNLTCNLNQQTELKITKNITDFCELNEFVNKLRLIHKETTKTDTHRIKKLSLSELTKWIKCLALFNLSQQKFGITGSPNSVNVKKHTNKPSKLKQTQSTLNFSKSQSNLKIY